MDEKTPYKNYVILKRTDSVRDGLTVEGETLSAGETVRYLVREEVDTPGWRPHPATYLRGPLPHDWAFKTLEAAREAIDILAEHGAEGFWLEYARRRVVEAAAAARRPRREAAEEYGGPFEDDEQARTRAMTKRLFEFEAGLPHTQYVLKRRRAGDEPGDWEVISGPGIMALISKAMHIEAERLVGEGCQRVDVDRTEVELYEGSRDQQPAVVLKIEGVPRG